MNQSVLPLDLHGMRILARKWVAQLTGQNESLGGGPSSSNTRGFKSSIGMEGAFLLCEGEPG
jgi:hypothetical protein